VVAVAIAQCSVDFPLRAQQDRRYLYVAVPGADADIEDRTALGILVFDIDKDHRLVKRVSPWPAGRRVEGEQARAIVAHAGTSRLYVSTTVRLAAIDLVTERIVWDRSYDGHCCDRVDVSPDGSTIYAPAFGKPRWFAIDARDGTVIASIDTIGLPRQSVYSRDGQRVFLGAWESQVLTVVDAKARKVIREIGPFGGSLCPFTIDRKEAFAFATVDGLVGFEVADIRSGQLLDRVIAEDSDAAPWARYECPSHGIALTPDERELWLADGVDNKVRIFDATTYPPVAKTTVGLPAQPRWIAFSVDGRYGYPSTGDVIDTASKTILGALVDERGTPVRSERLVEVGFAGDRPVRSGRP
jgi:DNA-binding beta-propeller fold protein YncE